MSMQEAHYQGFEIVDPILKDKIRKALTMTKIKTESLRKNKYVIHPRKEVKRPEMQYKHVDGEKIWNKAWTNPAANHEDTINIADDDLPF